MTEPVIHAARTAEHGRAFPIITRFLLFPAVLAAGITGRTRRPGTLPPGRTRARPSLPTRRRNRTRAGRHWFHNFLPPSRDVNSKVLPRRRSVEQHVGERGVDELEIPLPGHVEQLGSGDTRLLAGDGRRGDGAVALEGSDVGDVGHGGEEERVAWITAENVAYRFEQVLDGDGLKAADACPLKRHRLESLERVWSILPCLSGSDGKTRKFSSPLIVNSKHIYTNVPSISLTLDK